MSALTIDFETGTNKLNKRTASAWHRDNYVVAAGYQRDGGTTFGTYYPDNGGFKNDTLPIQDSDTHLILFNAKFDLLWMWDKPELQAFFRRGGRIFDCQYVEYLLAGMQQSYHMASMDGTITQYGGTLKMNAVKEMWDAGIDTPDIPEDLLMKYLLGDETEGLEGDVNNTWLIFLGQMRRITNDFPPETLQMIKNRMDGLLATTEMEYNGLKLDIKLGNEKQILLKEQLVTMSAELDTFIPELPEGLVFNWNSIYHKSYLIYGGSASYSKWVQHIDDEGNGLYAKKTERWYLVDGTPTIPSDDILDICDRFKGGKRAGEPKTKSVQVPDLTKPKGAQQPFNFTFQGFTTPEKHWKSKALTDAKNASIYSTSADIILELAGTRNIPFLKLLQTRSKLKKDLGTYYFDEDKNGNRTGMLTLVGNDGIIHHKLNHTSTVTSRLSSSDPNSQNLPGKDKSEVKKLFISRFQNGNMAEIDYSQLEIVVQGVLSQDKQLRTDLNNKVDFHCKRLGIKLGEDYDSVKAKVDAGNEEYILMRKGIKSFSFERAYGAGAASIAFNNNMDIDEVKTLIKNEETMYPGVIAFDKTVEASIAATRELTNIEVYVNGSKFRLGRAHWFSPTGTKYVWTENEAPEFLWKHGKYTGFKPTERKNYPVQGEGAMIVQTMLGLVWRWLISHDRFDNNVLLVSTVHDCAWFDIAPGYEHTMTTAKAILEAVPQKFNKDFNMNIDVAFPTELELGPNMYDLHPYPTK